MRLARLVRSISSALQLGFFAVPTALAQGSLLTQFSSPGWNWDPWILASLMLALLGHICGLAGLDKTLRTRSFEMDAESVICDRYRNSVSSPTLSLRRAGRSVTLRPHGAASGPLDGGASIADLGPPGAGHSVGFSLGLTARHQPDMAQHWPPPPRTLAHVATLCVDAVQLYPLVLASPRTLWMGTRKRICACPRTHLFLTQFADVLVGCARTARPATVGLRKHAVIRSDLRLAEWTPRCAPDLFRTTFIPSVFAHNGCLGTYTA